ncbi:heat shock protein 70 family, partial [Collybia nuda]
SFENRNDFSETLTRAKFEELNIDLFNKTIKLVKKGLKDANCKKEEVNEILIVGGSTRIPRVQQLLNEFFSGKDPVREADSDNTTVHGAAIQGGILSGTGTDTNITLVDVCPHSRGIETIGGVFAILIPRNTAIPTKKSNIFTTPYDNQTSVNILVFEGEHPKTKHNNLLGSFELTGITPAPRLVPQIDVTFETDANGITQVRASDLGTYVKSITISELR